MKLYRLSKWESSDGHRGFSYFASRRAAVSARRQWLNDYIYESKKQRAEMYAGSDIDVIEVTPTREGILRFLNHYAAHPDNG
jgi:hypothetical protein